MTSTNRLCLSFLLGVLAFPVVLAPDVMAGEEQRAPPEARTAGTLGPAVMRAISAVSYTHLPLPPILLV